MSADQSTPSVQVGQWWQDNDPRGRVRIIEILRVEGDYAFARGIHAGRRTRIRLDRFRPNATGYRLVQDAP